MILRVLQLLYRLPWLLLISVAILVVVGTLALYSCFRGRVVALGRTTNDTCCRDWHHVINRHQHDAYALVASSFLLGAGICHIGLACAAFYWHWHRGDQMD